MQVQPYLDFDGRCDEAIEFYKNAIGAKEKMLMRFQDAPEGSCPGGKFPAEVLKKVMHAELTIGSSTINLSDGRCQAQAKFKGVCLSLLLSSDAEVERIFPRLAEGGTITMPLAKTFFASNFGMLTDRFGVSWMVIVRQ
jgi:PhnB protein